MVEHMVIYADPPSWRGQRSVATAYYLWRAWRQDQRLRLIDVLRQIAEKKGQTA